jgi:uncharacterized OB-fold protein
MSTEARPRPERTPSAEPFWEGLDRDELRLQHCTACGAWVFYPRPRCSSCLSDTLAWETVEAVGELYAFTVTRRPTAPMFAEDVPQVLAVVEHPVGVRMTTTLVVDDIDLLRVGLPVVGVFDHVEDGMTLLRFRPAD